jgi:hypothetical protein
VVPKQDAGGRNRIPEQAKDEDDLRSDMSKKPKQITSKQSDKKSDLRGFFARKGE